MKKLFLLLFVFANNAFAISELRYQEPTERITYEINFSDRLLNGVTVSSGVVTAKNFNTDATDNTVLVSTTATITSPRATFTVYNCTDSVRYKIIVRVTLSNSDLLEEDLLVSCKSE